MLKGWLNRRLAVNGSKLVLDDEDINEALVDLDDLLHVAMDRSHSGVKRVQVPPEVLRMVMERMASLTDEEINLASMDPDANTGQYL